MEPRFLVILLFFTQEYYTFKILIRDMFWDSCFTETSSAQVAGIFCVLKKKGESEMNNSRLNREINTKTKFP